MTNFDKYNTDGYTQEQLDALNAERDERLAGIDCDSEEYEFADKAFSDEISHR
jgi:hypothetical protein